MHEMSLAEGIVQLLEDQATAQGYHRVKQLWLEIGALAGVDLDALMFGLEVACRDTLADGAQVHVNRLPGRGWCMQCSREIELQARADACPFCGHYQIQVTGGEEMRVSELEVE